MSSTAEAPYARESAMPALPCSAHDKPELWFAEQPQDIHAAKQVCFTCPGRVDCLASALQRQEPWGVWGGEVLVNGTVVAHKRGRGRPRKHPQQPLVAEAAETAMSRSA